MTEPTPPGEAAVLAGKTVLITGAAKRVGAEIARLMHASGANLVLHYRSSAEDAAALERELNEARPGSALCAECDLLEVAQLPGLVARAVDGFGGLDVLINNASTFFPTPVGDITEIDWDDLLGTNLKAPLFLSQAAAPALQAARRADHQHRRHPRHAPPAPLSGVQRRQGGADHAHQVPRP